MGPRFVDGPLQAALVCASALSQRLHLDDLESVEQVITWTRTPEFPEIGRSAWIELTHPFEAQCGHRTQVISSLKLKGVGLRDHRGVTHHPSNMAYRQPDAHLGIDDHGMFCELWSARAPMGALALTRAVVEYGTARELSGIGPISEVPLFIYRYVNLEGFRDDSEGMSDLAVVVTGLPAETPARADSLVHYARQDPTVKSVLRDWARTNTGDHEFDWGRAQIALWRDYGKKLREFHGSGFYRHNAHSSNLGLGADGVFLVDLDSTRHMMECAPRIRTLQAVRDTVGGVFHIIADTVRSGELGSIGSASAMHGQLIDAFLGSYFPDVPRLAFEELKADAGPITSELWEKWAEGTFVATGVENPAEFRYQQFMTERYARMTRGLDLPALWCKLMPALARLHSLSTVAYLGDHACPTEVDEVADVFLRQRQATSAPA
jgi:hypothetical protein